MDSCGEWNEFTLFIEEMSKKVKEWENKIKSINKSDLLYSLSEDEKTNIESLLEEICVKYNDLQIEFLRKEKDFKEKFKKEVDNIPLNKIKEGKGTDEWDAIDCRVKSILTISWNVKRFEKQLKELGEKLQFILYPSHHCKKIFFDMI